jgi:hypothetical protein
MTGRSITIHVSRRPVEGLAFNQRMEELRNG